MSDPTRRFAPADSLRAPDLWEEARRRSTNQRPLPPEPPETSLGRRVTAAVVALAVFAAAGIFGWRALRPDTTPVEEPVVSEPLGSAFDDLPAGWTELPAPHEVRRGAATAWTGTELLVWGGYADFDEESVASDGFVFDATSSTWRSLPPSPLSPRALAASAWTGSELLVWGGWKGTYGYESAEGFLEDGAAYDPATDTWRALPPAPIEGRAPHSVWTGRELLVWGTTLRVEDRPRDGAAYDPATDTWRSIPEAPIELTDATAVWTGEEMIVFGAALCCGNDPESQTAIGAAYDLANDTWRRIANSDLSPQASTAAWNGAEMISWDYLNESAAYDPLTDTWRPLSRIPLDEFECAPESVAVDAFVLGDYCGLLTVYDSELDAWQDVTRRDLSGWEFELLSAPPAIVLLAQDRLDTSITRMFAYRPSTGESPSDGQAPPTEPRPFVPEISVEGDVAHVNVTFPDGSSATLVYPTELDLTSSGVQPDVAYIRNDPPSHNPIVFLHGPEGVEAAYVEGEEPRATHPLPDGGEASLWPATETDLTRNRDIRWWLAYRTAAWTVLVPLKQESDAELIATSLSVVESATGLPFVTASGPLELPVYFGDSEGPQLALGDQHPDPDAHTDANIVFLSPTGCTGGPEFAENLGYYGRNCLGEGKVFASIYGDSEFVQAVLEGLRVESFSPASS